MAMAPEAPAASTQQALHAGTGKAGLVFVRLCPSAEEWLAGKPYSDAEGKLLHNIITAMELQIEDVYCTYLYKIPLDRQQDIPDDIDHAREAFQRELKNIAPRVVVSFGDQLSAWLSKSSASVADLRKKELSMGHGISLIPSWGAAFLIENPSYKKPVWQDMGRVKNILAE